ncbi:MAG: hypothetical protein ACI8PQ_000140, partial [Planctomycetota bacterium]
HTEHEPPRIVCPARHDRAIRAGRMQTKNNSASDAIGSALLELRPLA